MKYKIEKVSLENQVCHILGYVSDVVKEKLLKISVAPNYVSSFVRICGDSVAAADDINEDVDSKIGFEIYFKCKKIRKVQIVFQYQSYSQMYLLNCVMLRKNNLYANLGLAYRNRQYAKSIYSLYKKIGFSELKTFLYNFNPNKFVANSEFELNSMTDIKQESTGIGDSLNVKEELVDVRNKYYADHDKISATPKVSIIIPNKDKVDLLSNCINSILTKTTYNNYEIIIVENNSQTTEIFNYYDKLQKESDNIRVLTYQGEFNYSKINNYAVEFATGEHYLFLNNDTEVITHNWIEELLIFSQHKEVGIVGAKLLYEDNTIQHSGVSVQTPSIKHDCLRKSRDYPNANCLAQVIAVTGACMMVQKSKFKMTGGFDKAYIVAFSDIDLCMQVKHHGYINIYTPYCELYHFESKTRGEHQTMLGRKLQQQESGLFHDKWSEYVKLIHDYDVEFRSKVKHIHDNLVENGYKSR